MYFLFAAILVVGFAVSVSAVRNVCVCERNLASTLVCSLDDPNDLITIRGDYCSDRIRAVSLRLLHHTYLSSSLIPRYNSLHLEITGDHLKEVSENAFSGHEVTLRFLEITKTSLTEVPTAALQNLHHLGTLNLAANTISSINCSLVNTSLKMLLLLDNQISNIYTCAFPLDLESLSLMNNLVETLNGSLRNHNQLTDIFMNRNKLTSLEGQLEGLDSLSSLYASWNKIESIGTDSLRLYKLRMIDLSHNRISELGNSLNCLVNLRHLDLSHNSLEILTEVFINLRNLRYLSISANNLRYLDNEVFSFLGNLETLVISENSISSLELKLNGLSSLKKLDASWNTIRSFRKAIAPLISIEELNLSHNRIDDFGDSANRFSYLKSLDLSYNDFEMIRPDAMNSFSNLQILNLSVNKLSSLDGSTFASLSKLRSLDLSVTGLRNLEDLMVPGFMGMDFESTSESSLEGCVCKPRDAMKTLRIEADFLACYYNYTELVAQLDQHNIEVIGC